MGGPPRRPLSPGRPPTGGRRAPRLTLRCPTPAPTLPASNAPLLPPAPPSSRLPTSDFRLPPDSRLPTFDSRRSARERVVRPRAEQRNSGGRRRGGPRRPESPAGRGRLLAGVRRRGLAGVPEPAGRERPRVPGRVLRFLLPVLRRPAHRVPRRAGRVLAGRGGRAPAPGPAALRPGRASRGPPTAGCDGGVRHGLGRAAAGRPDRQRLAAGDRPGRTRPDPCLGRDLPARPDRRTAGTGAVAGGGGDRAVRDPLPGRHRSGRSAVRAGLGRGGVGAAAGLAAHRSPLRPEPPQRPRKLAYGRSAGGPP